MILISYVSMPALSDISIQVGTQELHQQKSTTLAVWLSLVSS
jgi:hypothetical protein